MPQTNKQDSDTYDVVIAGGGINGCGIARDAAQRGLKVLLCETNDLASATSSASTKLIHGGLRYLEHYEFRLVQEALQEREVLLNIAPHAISPMRFILPHNPDKRPAWMIKIGLTLYDQLARRSVLAASESYDSHHRPEGEPLVRPGQTFEYSDCWVDDSRLVVLNAMDAKEHGATILTNTSMVNAKANEKTKTWQVKLKGKKETTVNAKVIVNATGPWASITLDKVFNIVQTKTNIRMVQGSHIVVNKLFEHDKAYILQNKDSRIVFAIPFQQNYTLIGTTDQEYKGDPIDVKITDGEIEYLIKMVNSYFVTKVDRDDIVWSYSGVRGLYDDGATDAQEVTRDYVLKTVEKPLPILNVFGGKLTTYRRLAKTAVNTLVKWCPTTKICRTGSTKLPGGDLSESIDEYAVELTYECEGLNLLTAYRLAQAYGTRVQKFLKNAKKFEDLGKNLGRGLTQAEVDYLVENEWVVNADDILWRRSKLGLRFDEQRTKNLQDYLASK